MKAMMKRAKALRIPTSGVWKEAAGGRFAFDSKLVKYDGLTIVSSYVFRRSTNGADGYFWAIYQNKDDQLVDVSEGYYSDEGHALAAAFEVAAQMA